ncbi:MAG: glycosyltransferase [Blautia sp.]
MIHKENSGVSDTRNRAMRHAKGTYLQFVDCDDWLTVDATGLMTKAAMEHESDLVIADFYRVSGKKSPGKATLRKRGN